MRAFTRFVGVWIAAMLPAAAIGAVSRPCLADVSAADKAAAQALFDDGKRLFLEKRYADACPRFEKSQRLDPGIGTLLYLADCYESTGLITSAWATFQEAAGAAKQAGQAEREQVARGRAALLEPKLYRLTMKISQPEAAGLTVKRNGTDVPREVWNVPVPIDPGKYTIEAAAPGRKPWSFQAEIPQGAGAQSILIPSLAEEAKKPPPSKGAEHSKPITHPGRGQRIAGIAVGVAGIAGLAVGSIFGARALSKNTDAQALCRGVRCINGTGVDTIKQARQNADISTGAFIGGGVAVALGVTLFFTAPSEVAGEPSSSSSTSSHGRSSVHARSSVWVEPAVDTGSLGFLLGGRF